MKFSEWLRLDEIQHVSLPQKMSINGVLADGIDFRFEDWRKGYNPTKHDGSMLAPMPNATRFFNGPFSAPLQSGMYLNVSHHEPFSVMSRGGPVLALSLSQKVSIKQQPTEIELPKRWFDFAILYLGNKVVKPPEWPRSKHEVGQMAEVE